MLTLYCRQIRLGETSASTDSPFIHYPIVAIAGIFAVLSAIPLLAKSLYRSVAQKFGGGYSRVGGGGIGNRRYTSRSSFARGRDEYATVGAHVDEGELLGDESDEEV
jgi:hypothetical protein